MHSTPNTLLVLFITEHLFWCINRTLEILYLFAQEYKSPSKNCKTHDVQKKGLNQPKSCELMSSGEGSDGLPDPLPAHRTVGAWGGHNEPNQGIRPNK